MPVLAVFDAQASWSDTHVCDGWITDRLAAQGVRWGREDAPAPLAGEEVRVLGQAGLFYVPEGEGYLGLLLEAGEWVALPVGRARVFFDDGEGADDALPHAALPGFEAFVEEVLSLTGNDADQS